jgi:predicted nucleic acid-binding protein
MPFVMDASVTASRLLSDELHPVAVAAFDRFVEDTAMVPAIWWFEIRNMLVTNQRRGRIHAQRMAEALDMLRQLPITIDHVPDSKLVIELAQDCRLSVYDAAYLELAVRHNLPLATLDEAMVRGAKAKEIPLIR